MILVKSCVALPEPLAVLLLQQCSILQKGFGSRTARDNGKENGYSYIIGIYTGCKGVMEKKLETTIEELGLRFLKIRGHNGPWERQLWEKGYMRLPMH